MKAILTGTVWMGWRALRTGARERLGNPKLRLAPVPRIGEIVEVRTKLDHDSDTGLSLQGGVYVRERPEVFTNNEGRQWEISEPVRPAR